MKKRYIFLCILVIFVVLATILAWVNFDNIKAIYKAIQYDTHEIENRLVENEKKSSEMLEKYNHSKINPLSDEDSEKLTKGELTEEEAINLVLGKVESSGQETTDKNEVVQSKPSQTTETEQNQTQMSEEDENRLGELIAKVYVLKAKYNKLIHQENYEAADDFYTLPKEQQTKDKKYELGAVFMRNVLKLQDQCDAEMEQIFSEMETLLKANNMTLELVDEIKTAYQEEKELKKAYYVNKYTE